MKHRQLPVSLPADHVWLDGLLAHSPQVKGLVVLLQTTVGQHRESREAYLAGMLQRGGYATLILDLITRHEDQRDPDIRYNVPLLATRVVAASDWIRHQPTLKPYAVGLLAGGTASGAAIRAAARAPERFATLVCRAGRPDLAGAGPLRNVQAPMRLIVGSEDAGQAMLQQAFSLVTCPKDWRVVAGAGELFVEPGALETAGQFALAWFDAHLPPPIDVSEAPPEEPADDR
ncbi:MAG: alpha/beta hydrolase [Zoogloeaceae bacterium]|nr:alpha/beta hydrolase [Zoogloeaceae bacterium]